MTAIEILVRRALNIAALSLVLIFCPGLVRAQPLVATASPSGTFAATTPVMNAARENATATLLPDGKVLIAGGFDNASALSSTEGYQPGPNRFEHTAKTPMMSTARGGATATLLRNGKVLIAGGQDLGARPRSTRLEQERRSRFAATASTPEMNN